VFIARAIGLLFEAPLATRLFVTGRTAAIGLAVALLGSNCLACRSTFRDPAEWRNVTRAAQQVQAIVPQGALVAAHSSVLFYADRRGFTFAYGPDEIDYLFGTWGKSELETTPEQLLDFYRRQGARYFVELLGTDRERNNRAFFDYVITHYQVVAMEPEKYLIASLAESDR
jgi:hypothetical protein